MTAGLLYVTMQPKPGLHPSQFHDWYNNEHGPLRLRLPFFPNGYRFRAIDSDETNPYSAEEHEWVALYDITDSNEFTRPPYTTLREDGVKTEREKETMSQITVDRRMFDLIREWKADDYTPLEDVQTSNSKGYIIVPVYFRIQPGTESKVDAWYNDEHIALLQKVPGWRRSRRFVTSSVLNPSAEEKEYLAIHEYSSTEGQNGPEMKDAVSTEMARDIYANVVIGRVRRVFEWYYTFGPAPKDLHSLSDPSYSAAFSSRDGLTHTWAASVTSNKRAVIESFITTPDGAQLPYRLEGSPDPEAPLIILINSILSDWGIWDEFLDIFFSNPKNQKYRIVRYRPRGRSSDPGNTPITMDLLSKDVIAILDALRVPRAAAVVGVSLGGATTLNTALKYPSRVEKFVACDTNSLAPPSNPSAWAERIALAESDTPATDPHTGARLVGEKLAQVTTKRWFTPDSYDGGIRQSRAEKVKQYVFTNHLEGFKKSVKALYSYDLREDMKTGSVRGLFVVGSGDGILPQGMKKMAEEEYAGGKRAELKIVEGAGHLPMAEQPEEFAKVIDAFL
ncbi:alpha/beta hydrolase, putative [Talaromyces stipitatus ATCC 10500]|uniref:Alpha/beta hydrolase, putative n=1 Tax=Talaromyces stipitatus (strain ATCC 10500 / CBS 375.48 / QM 6759 / NRRL 1006) TaxID=441959 RepID=B8MGD8_TALSN|nr:alpha/beta hydrolase, putative [Talaromyces stipitatus ATCC 10500]EED16258.1 alpha/beta hydrolase, putative [Talaromyces stipitatus ATCC 10500]